jgi:hypothetical protein
VVGGGTVVVEGAGVDVVLATVPAVAAVVGVGDADPDRVDPPPQPATATTAATSTQPRRTNRVWPPAHAVRPIPPVRARMRE